MLPAHVMRAGFQAGAATCQLPACPFAVSAAGVLGPGGGWVLSSTAAGSRLRCCGPGCARHECTWVCAPLRPCTEAGMVPAILACARVLAAWGTAHSTLPACIVGPTCACPCPAPPPPPLAAITTMPATELARGMGITVAVSQPAEASCGVHKPPTAARSWMPPRCKLLVCLKTRANHMSTDCIGADGGGRA